MTEPANQPVPELSDEELAFLHSTFDLARQGEAAKLLALIGEGLPVDLTNPKGDTLLILAAYNGHNDLVRGLVELGATVDRLNDKGQSALTCAVFRQNADLTRFLLESGADPKLGPQNAWAVTEMFELPAMREVLEKHSPSGGSDQR
ncbi:MAG: ankyrin repeat domain-containing protein [Arthrobacter sp.]|uniref:ankyrin repeat domain-containing protein n=1 Tax=unclassified Arthrobacter TaxID=235627 RepID=UPI0026534A03|nr:ankyrin repeat domain-containing protein [Micrococcaceae bacterium]MDN5811797.1 ankyrin repeat domain-containing protein [Micrococcaceae bacterium]MDN5822770.1 ankyrin repeat domain-containing protein [Micrococcaceae bacterium]MDN5878035.1 ankyrin repeat domain-containing protein [Micrococcaceae bacterium]MDN5885954.1 ankyrin repeat domain-containing protein [Micrococcaceae bacterium]